MVIRADGATGQAGRQERTMKIKFFIWPELVAAGCATCTVMPSAMESGGLMMTRSVALNPLNNFNGIAKIAAEFDGSQLHLVVAADHGDLHSLRAENQRVVRKRQHMRIGGFGETHLRVAAGKNFAARIGHLQFHLQRARSRINRAGGARDLGLENPAGQFLKVSSAFWPGAMA